MRKTIIFHIGLEKTGTTSFQRFCHEHRRELSARGVLYPTRNLAFARESRNHAPLVAAYYRDGAGWADFNLARSWKDRRAVVDSLVQEIERDPVPTALISAEHLSSRFYPFQIERLAEDFAGFDIRIAIVLRGHEERAYSAYSSTIRAGRSLTLDAFVDELLVPENWYCRYAETILRWRRVFGEAAVAVFPFRKSRNVIDILWTDMLGLDGAPPHRAKGYFVNTDHGASVLEAMRRVNEALAVPEVFASDDYLRYRLSSLTRSAVLRALARAPRRPDDRLRMSGERRERFAALVDEDLARLAALDAIELPRLSPIDSGLAEAALIEERAKRLLEDGRFVAASLKLAQLIGAGRRHDQA
jgi:hypothetical protein